VGSSTLWLLDDECEVAVRRQRLFQITGLVPDDDDGRCRAELPGPIQNVFDHGSAADVMQHLGRADSSASLSRPPGR